jgi:thiol-disulfide isomerase/thioredoxin
MKPVALLVSAVVVLAVLAAGCATPKAPAGHDSIMKDIDAALLKGPVFVEFGAPWCSWCSLQKLLVEEIAKDYPGVTFMDVNTDENGALAKAFYVGGIPQMNVIVKKNPDGSYLYAAVDGSTTGDRKRSAIVGYTEKPELKKALDAAVNT